jgi:hypothetical protein
MLDMMNNQRWNPLNRETPTRCIWFANDWERLVSAILETRVNPVMHIIPEGPDIRGRETSNRSRRDGKSDLLGGQPRLLTGPFID